MSLLFLPVIPSPLLQSYADLRGREVESTAFANSVVLLHQYSRVLAWEGGKLW